MRTRANAWYRCFGRLAHEGPESLVGGRRGTICLTALLAAALALRIYLYRGPIGSDDLAYASLAHRLATSDSWFDVNHDASFDVRYRGLPVYPVRTGLYWPVALTFRLFGVNEGALALYPILVSLAMLVLLFVTARWLFSERAAFVAGALYAANPLDVSNSTVVLPDLPSAFFANLAILVLFFSARTDRSHSRFIYGCAAGLSLGLSWLCKESVLFFIPFTLLLLCWAVVMNRDNATLGGGCAVGASIVLGFESLFYYAHTSDPFFHLHAMASHAEHPVNVLYFWSPNESWTALRSRLLRGGPHAIFLDWRFALVPTIALVGLVARLCKKGFAVFRNDRSFAFVALWFVCLVAVYNFGSQSLLRYQPLPIDGWPRYLYPLVFPSILLCSAFLDRLLSAPRESARLPLTVAVLVLALLLFGTGRGLYMASSQRRLTASERAVARIVTSSDRLYTDPRSQGILEFYWRYPVSNAVIDFASLAADVVQPGAYVFVDHRSLDVIKRYGYTPPAFATSPPGTWTLIWHDGEEYLYRVPASNDLVSK